MPLTISISPSFSVIGSEYIRRFVAQDVGRLVELVKATYLIHGRGQTINPDSYFLRFPERPSARIIALPAVIEEEKPIAGLKWISSFPNNLARGFHRASAVLILNNHETGYPFACLEGSIISAARTAASAVAAAEQLHSSKRIFCMGVIGAGPIARTTCEFLLRTGWQIDEFRVLDLNKDRAQAFVDRLSEQENLKAGVEDSPEALLARSDLILFATTAAGPYIENTSLLAHNPTILHISLRDVSTEIVLACQNIVDDVEHCLKAGTSVHLTEQKVGHRNFINGTLADMLIGKISPDKNRPRLFSPFGLGVLDIAVGNAIYEASLDDAEGFVVPNFLPKSLDIAFRD